MAKALAQARNLIAWQIDNSLGGTTPGGIQRGCAAGLALWLEAKYETVERMNDLMACGIGARWLIVGRRCPWKAARRCIPGVGAELEPGFCRRSNRQFVKNAG